MYHHQKNNYASRVKISDNQEAKKKADEKQVDEKKVEAAE